MNAILTDALQGQVNDMYTAQEILNVLDELNQKKDMMRAHGDMDADWLKPEKNDDKDTYDEAAAELVAEDRARMRRSKLHAKLDAELEAYHKRKYDDTSGTWAASSSSTSAKRQTAEQPAPMEVDGTAAEEDVDYTEDTFEC